MQFWFPQTIDFCDFATDNQPSESEKFHSDLDCFFFNQKLPTLANEGLAHLHGEEAQKDFRDFDSCKLNLSFHD